jgi:hypothetical protein
VSNHHDHVLRLTPDALVLAGFGLAHAVWSVSDLPAGELLTPLAVVPDAERGLYRFEAARPGEAIAAGREAMAEARRSRNAYAFAWEGARRSDGAAEDACDSVVVEFWGSGMEEPAEVLQEFRHFVPDHPFHLVGDPAIVLAGKALAGDQNAAAIDDLTAGIRSHARVRDLWDGWRHAGS